jgi:hypothetical protein
MNAEPDRPIGLRMRDCLALAAAFAVCVVTAPYWFFFDDDHEEESEPHPAFRHEDSGDLPR